jgi:drug/metabolite transporter (DMT)-like permease
LLARVILAEPLHRHTLVAMGVGACGLVLSVAGSLRSGAALGMAVSFIVVLCISMNYVIVRRRRDVGMTPSLALAGLFAALVSLPFAHPSSATAHDFPWLLALGPGQLAAGLLLYIAALKRIPAGRAALLGLLELVLGPIWVWAFDGERPGDLTLLGGVVVIGSAAANVWLDSRRPTG